MYTFLVFLPFHILSDYHHYACYVCVYRLHCRLDSLRERERERVRQYVRGVKMEVYECDTHIHKRRGGKTIWRQERDALGVSTPVSLQTCVCVKGEEGKEEEEGKLLPCWWCERAREK